MIVSNVAVYLCVNSFGSSAVFSDAIRPQYLARHALEDIAKLTIGFLFQRLLIAFEGDYVYARAQSAAEAGDSSYP